MFGSLRGWIVVMIMAVALVVVPLIVVAVVLISGTCVSNLLVGGNGVESFEGEERAFAEAAAGQAEEIFSEVPGSEMWTTAYRVAEVRAGPDPPEYKSRVCWDGGCYEPWASEGTEFSAELQTYTYFGLYRPAR